MTPERSRCLESLARLILHVERPHPVRVAIDGPDAAGKTILADELAPLIERSGRTVIRASIDGFHRPRAKRLARGPESPEGYFRDSFDYPAFRTVLVGPLGPGGNREYRRRVFDFPTDMSVEAPVETAPRERRPRRRRSVPATPRTCRPLGLQRIRGRAIRRDSAASRRA
jgi:uridine kinase